MHAHQHLELCLVTTGHRDHWLKCQIQAFAIRGERGTQLVDQVVGGGQFWRHETGNPGGQGMGFAGGILGCGQHGTGIGKRMLETGIPDCAAQPHRFAIHQEVVIPDAITQAACETFQCAASQIAHHH